MNNRLYAGALLTAFAATPAWAEIEVSGNVTLTTDYVVRGYTQTNENPAFQAGLDVNHSSGLYAGVWGSSIDFGDDATMEIDYLLGYAGEVGNMGYDVGFLYYSYPDADGASNYDYWEVKLGGSYQNLSAEYYYTNEFFGKIGPAHYITAAYEQALADDVALTFAAGYQAFDDNNLADNYTDWSVTLSTTLGGFDFSMAYIDTDLKNVNDIADERLVFSIGKSF